MTRLTNPAPQHFDSIGNPLSGGKLYFYEVGSSTTLKDTFSDVNLSIANANPVILDKSGLEPNIFLDGSYRVVLQDKNGVHRWVRDNVNLGADSPFALWVPTISYGLGGDNIVTGSDGNYYVSLDNNNLANDPTTSPTKWDRLADELFDQQEYLATGEILAFNAALAAGADGTVLEADSAAPLGVKWGAAGQRTRPISERTANTILVLGDSGTYVKITSGTFTQTFDPVADLAANWFVVYQNAGTGLVTLDPNASEQIDGLSSFVMYPGENRVIQCDGSKLTSYVISPFKYTFTTSGTFTTPPGYVGFEGLVWGGGGGGITGSGGGGGACVPFELDSSVFGASETVTIAAGGSTGVAGGNSSIGSLAVGYGGAEAQSSTQGGGGGGAISAASGADGGAPIVATTTALTNTGFGGGNAGSNGNGGDAAYGGGGGAGTTAFGGNAFYGGGGGSGLTASSSVFGGAGGAAGDNGVAPAGGGGAGTTSGARGEIRIWGIA